jgi:hypothetical protein
VFVGNLGHGSDIGAAVCWEILYSRIRKLPCDGRSADLQGTVRALTGPLAPSLARSSGIPWKRGGMVHSAHQQGKAARHRRLQPLSEELEP